jgi:DNA-binding SARP family transcriptional activator
MLLMHPDGCTKEQIGLAFWPEASTAQLRNNFHVTLHRLRKALGHADWITLAHERYRVDPSAIASFDVIIFEKGARAALELARGNDAGAVAGLEHATSQYRGELLDGEPAGDWHIPHRDRLQQLYVECLMALGEAHTTQQRHVKAIEAYRRVLARDGIHEDAVRALMIAGEQSGDRGAAIKLYDRFAERLRQELKATPSAETTAIYRRLKAETVNA